MASLLRAWAGAALPLATLLLAGCAASTSPALDERFGDSVRVLRAQQALDASAPARNAGQTVRSDGRAAAEATARYVDTFKAPPAPVMPIVGFGGGGGAAPAAR